MCRVVITVSMATVMIALADLTLANVIGHVEEIQLSCAEEDQKKRSVSSQVEQTQFQPVISRQK